MMPFPVKKNPWIVKRQRMHNVWGEGIPVLATQWGIFTVANTLYITDKRDTASASCCLKAFLREPTRWNEKKCQPA